MYIYTNLNIMYINHIIFSVYFNIKMLNPPKYNLREKIYDNSDKSISIYKVYLFLFWGYIYSSAGKQKLLNTLR